ncbi:archease [Candidatus Woesearchaeota archaeon]|nr:archease [Candidatus Woesearchaeota archaeon]
MKYKYLEHTADIKFRSFGRTLNEAFSNAAYAMINIISEDKIKEKMTRKIKVRGIDRKSLLYSFLEEILFLLNTKNFLLSKVKEIKIKDKELTATLSGDNLRNYRLGLDVKAVTYNDMFIKEKPYVIQVVLDI